MAIPKVPPESRYWSSRDWDRWWLNYRSEYEAKEDRYVGYAEKGTIAGLVLTGLIAGIFGGD